jgi:hypothetical protein
LQLLLDFRTTCRFVIYENKPHIESGLIDPFAAFLSGEEGFSTCLEQSSSKRFTKRWIVMCATELQSRM